MSLRDAQGQQAKRAEVDLDRSLHHAGITRLPSKIHADLRRDYSAAVGRVTNSLLDLDAAAVAAALPERERPAAAEFQREVFRWCQAFEESLQASGPRVVMGGEAE